MRCSGRFSSSTFIMLDVQSIYSLVNSGLIPTGRNLSKRQTVFFTSVDPMNKEQKDPDAINLDAPRLAWYKQKVWKRHEYAVYWVDIKVAQKKGFKIYQTRSNAIILYDTHSQIQKAIMLETGEIKYDKVYASSRLPPFFQGQKMLEVLNSPDYSNQRPNIQL